MNDKIAIEFAKMTNNGISETVATIPFVNKIRYFPSPDKINKIIPEIENDYNLLVKSINSDPPQSNQYLTKFFNKTSQNAIVGRGLIKCLSSDLRISYRAAFQMVFNSDFIWDRIKYLQKEFRKSKKENSIKYLESCHLLIDLFGSQNTMRILQKNNIKMGQSTLQALHKVSTMPPQIKEMIGNGELLLTAAFEIPQIDEEKQIEMAEAMKNKNYSDAKKIAKRFSY